MPLPPLYEKWVAALVGGLPEAPPVDCVACSQSAPRDPGLGVPAFTPDLKCCTYPPILANFQVGGALRAPDGGPAALVERVSGAWATPLALEPAPEEERRYAAGRHEGFGRDPALRCPFLVAGRCGVWSHRNAVCATWWCRSGRGAVGARFYTALRDMLGLVEDTLASWCARTLGVPLDLLHFPDGRPRRANAGDVHGWESGAAATVWGDWYGRRSAFYVACARLVDRLDGDEVMRIGGVRLELAVDRARAALARCADRGLPAVVCVGNHVVADLGEQVALTTEETVFDPLVVPAQVVHALPRFDGRPTHTVLAETGLSEALAGQLVDHGVLGAPVTDLPQRHRPTDPLTPASRLSLFRSFRGAEPSALLEPNPDGGWTFRLTIASREIEFDEPDLAAFGRALHAHRGGFRAGEAAGWGTSGRSWARTRELLEALCEAGVLQRLPEPDAGAPAG